MEPVSQGSHYHWGVPADPQLHPNQQCKIDADCNDNNACTADLCNTFNSTCVHVNLPGCMP